ncbi:MAG: hypothetical protein C0505_05300 [Leptothrix sp. (in: Bacteria)]|nr:hypothetical protein [Leptothrix sp. (in: b-proteobacteria)]
MKSHLGILSLIAAVLCLGANAQAVASTTQAASPKAAAKPAAKLVDINSASRAQLKTLPGIGDAEADRIVAARPYPSKAKLAADKVLSPEAYAALKGRIVAVQKTQPKPRANPQPKAKAGTEGKASAPPASRS